MKEITGDGVRIGGQGGGASMGKRGWGEGLCEADATHRDGTFGGVGLIGFCSCFGKGAVYVLGNQSVLE